METLAFLRVPNMFCIICKILVKWKVTPKHRWLKHCATSLKVAGLIAAVVIELTYSFQAQFRPANDSACKRNRSQEYIFGHEGSRCSWLTTLLPSFADYLEILGDPDSSTPRCSSKSVQGLLYLIFELKMLLILYIYICIWVW